MQEIQFYCRNCKKSLRISYAISGNESALVLPNIIIKCSCCKRTMFLKKYTEKKLIAQSVGGKFYI